MNLTHQPRHRNEVGEGNSSSGIGLGGALFLVFLVLKLTHAIDWSWWWITAPLWVPAILLLLIAGVALVIALIVGRDR